jgi:hypothetical protein
VRLNVQAGKTQWKDATALEMARLHEYDTFKDCGHRGDTPKGFKKIQDLDWATSVYGNSSKILPTNAPTPLGKKYVTLTHYFDAPSLVFCIF